MVFFSVDKLADQVAVGLVSFTVVFRKTVASCGWSELPPCRIVVAPLAIAVVQMSSADKLLPPITVDKSSPTPLYEQLYTQIRDAIDSGRLKSGTRLPSTRSLAAAFGISRNTVNNAVDQLRSEGLLDVCRGMTARVSAIPYRDSRLITAASPESNHNGHKPPTFSAPFSPYLPAIDRFPTRIWSKTLRAKSEIASLLAFTDSFGHHGLRQSIATFIAATRGVQCSIDQVLVGVSVLHLFSLLSRTVLNSGSSVAFENPGYWRARSIFALAGQRIVPVPVDDDGLCVDQIIKHKNRLSVVHFTPSCQVPTGAILSTDRKEQLIRWASQAKAWLIEDDFGADLDHQGAARPSVYSMDRSARTLYLGSFAVSMFPGLKLAYLVIPSSLIPEFHKVTSLEGISCPLIVQAAMAEFIDSGNFGRHLRTMRTLYGERKDTLLGILHRAGWPPKNLWVPPCGVNLVMHLDSDDVPVTQQLAKQNIRVEALSSYYTSNPKFGIVAGFGHMNTEELAHQGPRLIDQVRGSGTYLSAGI